MQLKQTYAEIDATETELACFEALQQQERAAMPLRVEALQAALQAQTDREAMLQARLAFAITLHAALYRAVSLVRSAAACARRCGTRASSARRPC